MKLRIVNVVGARPNFMKMAPLMLEYRAHPDFFEPMLVHTGQHYDDNMSKLFFEQLHLPEPDLYLGIGSGSHAEQTGKVMIEMEKLFAAKPCDLLVVVGDVNSTLAATIVAAKRCIPIAHVEAGLRSFDRAMPEEVNRLVTDVLSDFLFTTSPDAEANLRREGVPAEKIHFVGNVMIDTLLRLKAAALQSPIREQLGIADQAYAFVTLHRPSNVDVRETFAEILSALRTLETELPLVFPVHPRTAGRLKEFGFWQELQGWKRLKITEPLGYLDSICLMAGAKMVLTDSGGVQEETTALGIPCLTIRENTERPITVTEGTNTLVGRSHAKIVGEARRILNGEGKCGRVPKFWDGHASRRIVQCLLEHHPKKVVLFGIPIDNLTMDETLDRIEEMIHSGKTHQHVVVNVDKIVKLQGDPALRAAIMECDLINADGQPVVWASRFLQTPLKERVAGVDLFSELVQRCAEHGHRPYLLGAKKEVVERVAAILAVQHPSLQLAGWQDGYWKASEEAAVVAKIKAAKPDVLFVAMGSPKKELFLNQWKKELQIPFVMGVGGTFDVVSGLVKRAPRWMQKCGLEWLYRLIQEPRRLWRRYLVEDMTFFGLVMQEWRLQRKLLAAKRKSA